MTSAHSSGKVSQSCKTIHIQVSEQISHSITRDQLVFDTDYIFAIPTPLFSRRNTIHNLKTNMPHKMNKILEAFSYFSLWLDYSKTEHIFISVLFWMQNDNIEKPLLQDLESDGPKFLAHTCYLLQTWHWNKLELIQILNPLPKPPYLIIPFNSIWRIKQMALKVLKTKPTVKGTDVICT